MLKANRRTTENQSINPIWCNETFFLYMMCVMYFMLDKFEMRNKNLFQSYNPNERKDKK